MGALRKIIVVVLGGMAVLIVGYFVARGLASWHQGYSWAEMDWNQDGTTSIAEFLNSSDVGKRSIEKDGQACIEYFAFKDGLPVKTICPVGVAN